MTLRVVLSAAAIGALAGPAHAHELVVLPSATAGGSGDRIEVQVHSTHVFIEAEEMEALDNVAASLVQNGAETEIALEENEKELRLDGSVELNGAGPAILVGHRLPLVFLQTPDGSQEGSRADHPDALSSNKFEKFSKVLINLDADDDTHLQPLGHPLELVPLANPAGLGAGDVMEVRVLHDGQPLSIPVLATYDGFTDVPNSYGWYSEEVADGIAQVKLSSPGLWVIRVEHRAEVPEAEIDHHVLRATLLFEVE